MNQKVVKTSSGQFVPSYGFFTCVSDFLPEALKLWYERNSILPYSIIVYRDGVGDGQLQALIDYEIPQIVSSLESIFNAQK